MGRKRKSDSSSGGGDCFSEEEEGSPGDSSSNRCDSPAQRNNANSRERARMRVLSKGFTKLKTALPWVPPDTKLSKLDTLRLASCYIAHLRQLLDEDGTDTPGKITTPSKKPFDPLKLSWPYTFNGKVTASLDNRPTESGRAGRVKTEQVTST